MGERPLESADFEPAVGSGRLGSLFLVGGGAAFNPSGSTRVRSHRSAARLHRQQRASALSTAQSARQCIEREPHRDFQKLLERRNRITRQRRQLASMVLAFCCPRSKFGCL